MKCLLMAALFLVSTAASAQLSNDFRRYTLKPKMDPSKCVDWDYENLSKITSNLNVVLNGCHGGNNQAWSWFPGSQEFHSFWNTNYCLDWDYINSSKTAHNRNVTVYNCTGADNQKWIIDGDLIRSVKDPSMCLDMDYANSSGIAHTNNLTVHPCHGADNQRWIIQD